MSTFWRNCHTIFQSNWTIWHSLQQCLRLASYFSTFLSIVNIISSFDYSHSPGCEVISLGFWYAFPWCLKMLSIPLYAFCHLPIFFRKLFIQIPCPFLLGYFSIYWLARAPCIFWMLVPYQTHVGAFKKTKVLISLKYIPRSEITGPMINDCWEETDKLFSWVVECSISTNNVREFWLFCIISITWHSLCVVLLI